MGSNDNSMKSRYNRAITSHFYCPRNYDHDVQCATIQRKHTAENQIKNIVYELFYVDREMKILGKYHFR